MNKSTLFCAGGIAAGNRLLIFFVYFILVNISSEVSAQINLNITNGLPTNYVYSSLIDRYGYLWLTTPKGVLKYNGYEFRQMATSDVWDLYEDKKGRMWLCGITDELGYIFKDKYYKTYKVNSNPNTVFVPLDMKEYAHGIYFYSTYYDRIWCVEKNDTIIIYNTLPLFTKNNKSFFFASPNTLQLGGSLYKLRLRHGKMVIGNQCDSCIDTDAVYRQLYNNTIIYDVNNGILMVDTRTFKKEKIVFAADESVYAMGDRNNFLYILTNKNVYKANPGIKIEKKYSFKELLGPYADNGDQLSFFQDNSFWGNIVSTLKSGIYLHLGENSFKQLDMPGFIQSRYAGSSANQIHFWWNELTRTLNFVNINGTVTSHRFPLLKKVKKILPADSSRSLIVSYDNLYWLNHRTKKLSDFLTEKTHYRLNINGAEHIYTGAEDVPDSFYMMGYRDADICGNDLFLLNRYQGVNILTSFGDTLQNSFINKNRYDGVVYHPFYHHIYAYNDKKIWIYNTATREKLTIESRIFNLLKIKKIEKIIIDKKFGNILIKDVEKLFVYNLGNNTYKELFCNINLTGSELHLAGSTLVIGGKFGVLVSKITGITRFSEPFIYQNIKAVNYNHLFDIQPSEKEILINTNNGMYSVKMPGGGSFTNTVNRMRNKVPFKFIMQFADTLLSVETGDTIYINPETELLRFDIINPLGVGFPRYQYNLQGTEEKTEEMNVNELHLPHLASGEYHTVTISAYDDVWRSKPIYITLYVVPYWWQKAPGRQIIWFVITCCVAFILALTALITKKILERNIAQRNQLLELQLKSLYSQMNPHFIFNTLNSALHLIKKQRIDDADNHIIKFSKLLRSYLKSSRNRYIPLSEEIANLTNYIELQQTRFDNIFTYEINLNNISEPRSIKIPSLLLQPIVENAINHGLLPKEGPGHLRIEFRQPDNNSLVCLVEDNGIGREKSKLNNENNAIKKESYGSQLIKELIEIFNKYEKTGIEIEYIDKQEPSTGTIVKLVIKNLRL